MAKPTDQRFIRQQDLTCYLKAGFQLIPLNRWDATNPKGKPSGKQPRELSWQSKDYDSAQVAAQAAKTGANVGVRLTASILVLDVDPRNYPEGRHSLNEFVADLKLDLSACPHVITGSGGHHYYFSKPADVSVLDSLDTYQGIEFKSFGRQVVSAGSIHPNGKYYEWDDLAPFPDDPEGLPPLPDNMLRLIRRPVRAHGDALGLGDLTPEMLAKTLEQLEAEDFKEHDKWRDLMMACHYATNGEGRQEFIDWSTQDGDYADDGWVIGRRWDSLHVAVNSGGRPVTIKHLHQVVQAAGGLVEVAEPEDDFDVYEHPDQDGWDVDDDKVRAEPPAPTTGTEFVMETLNTEHCVVMDGGKFRIFTEQFDPVLKRPFFQRSTKDDFENLYSNQLVEVGDKLLTWSHVWLRSAKRRQYKGIIFDPEHEHEGWLNLWRGWAVEPKRGKWDKLQDLILNVLVDGNQAHYEYVLNWMAYMVQHPNNAAEVAICFKGEKGTGKGTLGRALSSLAGSHGLHISSPEHLVGRFNSHLQNCICLFADEAFWAGDKAGESKLKQLVTEPTLTYEGKGRDASSGKNLIHIMMASNNDWVVPAGLDGERRFCVFQVNSKRRGDKAYFDALNKQLSREQGLEAMLYDLLMRDITDWAPRNNVPDTGALIEQKEMSMDDVELWWYNKLHDAFIPNLEGDWTSETDERYVIKELLYLDYVEFARGQRVYRPADPLAFSRRLTKLVGTGLVTKQRVVSDVSAYAMVRVDNQGRAVVACFPTLAECRHMMNAKLGEAVTWPAYSDS
jgi:hypothetical protein